MTTGRHEAGGSAGVEGSVAVDGEVGVAGEDGDTSGKEEEAGTATRTPGIGETTETGTSAVGGEVCLFICD